MSSTRDFSNLDIYLNILSRSIYPQPPDAGHTRMASDVFHGWIPKLLGVKSVLDAGCGDTAFMKPLFLSKGIDYTGIALGVDDGTWDKDIINMDFTFTNFEDSSFDLVFARHSLEHSPMPIITLMEWERVSRHFLCLINPNPAYYGYVGRNHYSVANREILVAWASEAGWSLIWEDNSEFTELRFMFQKRGA